VPAERAGLCVEVEVDENISPTGFRSGRPWRSIMENSRVSMIHKIHFHTPVVYLSGTAAGRATGQSASPDGLRTILKSFHIPEVLPEMQSLFCYALLSAM